MGLLPIPSVALHDARFSQIDVIVSEVVFTLLSSFSRHDHTFMIATGMVGAAGPDSHPIMASIEPIQTFMSTRSTCRGCNLIMNLPPKTHCGVLPRHFVLQHQQC